MPGLQCQDDSGAVGQQSIVVHARVHQHDSGQETRGNEGQEQVTETHVRVGISRVQDSTQRLRELAADHRHDDREFEAETGCLQFGAVVVRTVLPDAGQNDNDRTHIVKAAAEPRRGHFGSRKVRRKQVRTQH